MTLQISKEKEHQGTIFVTALIFPLLLQRGKCLPGCWNPNLCADLYSSFSLKAPLNFALWCSCWLCHPGWLFPGISGRLQFASSLFSVPTLLPPKENNYSPKSLCLIMNFWKLPNAFSARRLLCYSLYAITFIFVVVCWEGCLYWNFRSFADLTKCLIPNCSLFVQPLFPQL